MIQLDFLQPLSEIEILREEVRQCRASNDKVRKGMFARHNELGKLYIDLRMRGCHAAIYEEYKERLDNELDVWDSESKIIKTVKELLGGVNSV